MKYNYVTEEFLDDEEYSNDAIKELCRKHRSSKSECKNKRNGIKRSNSKHFNSKEYDHSLDNDEYITDDYKNLIWR